MNDFRALIQLIIDKAQARNEVDKTIKDLQKEAQLKTDLKINASDVKKAQKELSGVSSAVTKLASESQRLSKVNTIKTWADNNSKAMKVLKADVNGVLDKLQNPNLSASGFKQINAEFERIKSNAREMGLLGKTVGDSFKDMGSKFVSWITVSGGIMAVFSGIRKMKDAAIELNEAITDLDMATGSSKKQLESYIESYSKLGDELSATVKDVTISGTEWLKQGKSIAETEELIRDAMILDKVGKLGSAESTKYLTSAMKGYNVATKDTLGIVDKLSAVDMESATDVGGLAEGMSEVASSADLAGISMDRLLGYLAVIGETTQDSMSSVGRSLNAIFSRMGNVKLSRLKDYQNSGEDLSNVETVLRGEGINLRDSQNSFRNFGDVLDEVSGKWTSFSEVSQHAIASAFAGTDHINDFLILMSQYDTALKYTETSLKSSGSAMEKFNAYQDSVAAHSEIFKNAFMGLSNTVVDSGIINYLIDLGTTGIKSLDAVASAVKYINSLGGNISSIGGTLGALSGLLMSKTGMGVLQYDSEKGWGGLIVDIYKAKKGIIDISEESSNFFDKTKNWKPKSLYNLSLIDEDKFQNFIKDNNLADESLIKFLKDSKQGTKDLASYQEYLKTTGKQTSGFADLTQKAGNIVKGFGAALGSMAVMWAIGEVVSLAAKGFDELKNKVENTKNSANDLISTFSSAITQANSNADTIESLSSKYETLSKGVNNLGENVSLTTDEYTEYNNIVNQIADMFPNLISGYTNEGNAILSLKGNVEQLRDAYKDAQKEAYNMLVASGENSDGNDIIKDYQNVVSGFKGVFAQDEMGAKQVVDMLTELNSSFGDVDKFKSVLNEFQKLANENNEAYHSKEFQGILDDIGINDLFGSITNISSLDDDDLNKASDKIAEHFSKIKATIQTYQAEIDSVLNNTRTLANAYLMTNDDYNKLDEQSKNAASVIVNSLNENIASGFESKEDVGAYVQDILSTINSNPEVKSAMVGLLTLDYSDMPVEKSVEIINQYINYIAEMLGENPLDLKIRLGFDDFDKLETQYKNAITSAQEKFGKDETGFFESNSINTKEEIDAWLGIAQAASSAEEAERKYIEQGKTVSSPSFIPEFENLPTDKIEEYISLVKSGNIDEGTISSYSELNDLIQKTGMSAEDAAKALKDYADGYKLSTDLTSNIQAAYDLLKDVEEQYKKTGLIGLSSLESVANTYPQLRNAVNEYTQGLISADDMMAQLSVTYENDADVYKAAMAYKLSGNEEFFTTIFNNNKSLFDDLANAYGLDVENWKTMAQAKAEIDQKLIQSLSAAWSKYYNIVVDSTSGMASVEGVVGSKPEGADGEMSKAQRNALDAAFATTDRYNDIINKFNEAANITINVPDFGGIGSVGNKSGSSGKEKSKKEYKEIFDWIATGIDRSDEKMDSLQNKISDASNWKPKNALTDTTIDEMSNKLTALQMQEEAYQKMADSYSVSPTYIDKIKNGTLEIETITDEVVGNNIKNYQEWYTKAEDVRKKIEDTRKSMQELAQSKLDNIINDFDSLVSLMEKYSSYNKSLIELQKDLGEEISNTDYEKLIDQQKSIYDELQSKYKTLSNELHNAVSSKAIKVGSQEWRKYNEELIDVNNSMNDVVSNMNDFRKSMIDLPFEELERITDATSRVNDEISSMLELIGSDGLIDGGMETSRGLTRLALLGKQLGNAKQEVANYGEAIEAVEEAYSNGTLTQAEYTERINEYSSAQLSAVNATKEAQDAILQFRYDAIQAEIDDMKNLISAKKEALQTEKDYQNYLDEINGKQKDISNLQAKIDELSLSTDRKDIAQRLQLEKDMADAKEELAKTQADYAFDQTLESLDKQSEEFEDSKNKELETLKSSTDEQQKVIENYLGKVKKDYQIVYNTLTKYGEDYGITMTDELTSPWESANSAVTTFQDAVSDAISQINIDIASIDLSKLTEMVSTMQGFSATGGGNSFEDMTGSGSWQKTSKGWWYGNSNDDYVSDGVYTIGGKQYNFNEDGYMKSGWDDSTGQWRYFEPENGQMVKSTWRKGADGKEYYLKSDGTMATDMAIKSKSENGYYYVNDDGVPEGGLLSYDEVKQRKITVGYKNGTQNSKPGLKHVGEDGPELIVTKDGVPILSSVGGDTIFPNDMVKKLWELGNTSLGMEKLRQNFMPNIVKPQYDFGNIKTVERQPISFVTTIQGNADEKAFAEMKTWVTRTIKDIPSNDRMANKKR